MNTIDHKEIYERSKKQLLINAIPFVFFFLVFLIWLLLRDGFAVNPETQEVYMENFKYLHNLLAMPFVLVLLLVGVVSVLWSIAGTYLKDIKYNLWYAGVGTVLVVFSLFLVAGFNNTAFYPSTFDLQSSLTIQNASSSHYTLTAMSYVSLLVPFVFAYIWYAWKSINVKKINEEEINSGDHLY